MQSEEAVKQINVIAPALRAILATGDTLRRVSFSDADEASSGTDKVLSFDVQAGEEPKATVARLKAACEKHAADRGTATQAVFVKGVGVFQVAEEGSAAQGRTAGKIAIVTGAAQGFGLEISQSFASEGGCVVLTDMNAEGAKKAAEEICRKQEAGRARAIGLCVNVTDAASIEAMVHQVVRTYGGFDVFISNAGVLKAGSVKTQSEKDFDFVTNVNYKGFFLCTQKAAPVLAVQRMAKADYYSDIIQINSKSGLQGSNKNGAYAGSKFGGIGLVQSFAMELIEDGIKVNAICPGNFFDGPLWSDPKTGLFVQYLNTGKVPGAKTIADVKRFYEAKVPMGRGCTTQDVMKAVCYLIDQIYETGQALPVTGGQVMLK
jgi:sorbitol-6-phosphate 2-dehydrogenase